MHGSSNCFFGQKKTCNGQASCWSCYRCTTNRCNSADTNDIDRPGRYLKPKQTPRTAPCPSVSYGPAWTHFPLRSQGLGGIRPEARGGAAEPTRWPIHPLSSRQRAPGIGCRALLVREARLILRRLPRVRVPPQPPPFLTASNKPPHPPIPLCKCPLSLP